MHHLLWGGYISTTWGGEHIKEGAGHIEEGAEHIDEGAGHIEEGRGWYTNYVNVTYFTDRRRWELTRHTHHRNANLQNQSLQPRGETMWSLES